MSLQGSLSELSLPDVVQLVSVSGKTGAFEIQGEHETGRIYLRDGQIVDAHLVPYFTSREQGADQVTLSPQEWILVTRIDGEHSIEDIAAELKWAPFDVSKLLFGMITTGLVALGNPGEPRVQGRKWQAGPSPVNF